MSDLNRLSNDKVTVRAVASTKKMKKNPGSEHAEGGWLERGRQNTMNHRNNITSPRTDNDKEDINGNQSPEAENVHATREWELETWNRNLKQAL